MAALEAETPADLTRVGKISAVTMYGSGPIDREKDMRWMKMPATATHASAGTAYNNQPSDTRRAPE